MRAALGFLTPLGGAREPTPRALPWFPAVGAVIGCVVWSAWSIGTTVWTPAVGAALAIVADLAMTGMLHIDGLGDAADGLLPHLDRERRLEVMAKPDIGAFGVAAIGAALLLQFAVLASMRPNLWLVLGLWGSTRAMAAATLDGSTYARPGGLAERFRGGSSRWVRLSGLLASIPLLIPLPVVLPVALGTWVCVVLVARRRLGGYTGDVLGAAIVCTQTVGLLAMAAVR